jgi:hypothetical protein
MVQSEGGKILLFANHSLEKRVVVAC